MVEAEGNCASMQHMGYATDCRPSVYQKVFTLLSP